MSNWVSKLGGSGAQAVHACMPATPPMHTHNHAPAVHTPWLLHPCMLPHACTHTPPRHAHMPVALPMATPSTHPHCPSKHAHMPIHPSIHVHHMPAHLYPHVCRSSQHMRLLLHLVFFSSASVFSTSVMNMV